MILFVKMDNALCSLVKFCNLLISQESSGLMLYFLLEKKKTTIFMHFKTSDAIKIKKTTLIQANYFWLLHMSSSSFLPLAS